MDFKKKYKDMQLKSWNQFYKNFVIKAFEMNDDEYNSYLKGIRCPFGFIGKASKAKTIHENIKFIKGLDEELKKTISIMASGDLFAKKKLTVSEWLTSKKWQDFKTEEDYRHCLLRVWK